MINKQYNSRHTRPDLAAFARWRYESFMGSAQ